MQSPTDVQKRSVGEKAVEYIQDGMIIGLGTGSTVYWMLKKLGELVKAGLNMRGVPSSIRTEGLAKEFGIPLVTFSEVSQLDLAIDGADEVDPNFNLIKGGGGSLLREKIVAHAATQLIIVVDETKLVPKLGNFPLPVEVVPFGWENTAREIAKLQCTPTLRMENGKRVITDNGNFILDCQFASIQNPEELHKQLKLTLGVVETGLFVKMANKIIVGEEKAIRVLDRL